MFCELTKCCEIILAHSSTSDLTHEALVNIRLTIKSSRRSWTNVEVETFH